MDGTDDFSQSFSDWLKVRLGVSQEICLHRFIYIGEDRDTKVSRMSLDFICLTALNSQVMFLRKSYGSRLNVFSPVNDLSSLSKSGSEHRSLVPGHKNDIAIAGGQILGDEYSAHVVKACVFWAFMFHDV